jgi:hypothetical protein
VGIVAAKGVIGLGGKAFQVSLAARFVDGGVARRPTRLGEVKMMGRMAVPSAMILAPRVTNSVARGSPP